MSCRPATTGGVVIAVLGLCATDAASQCPPMHDIAGPYLNENFGSAVAGGGDINGDGVLDFVVGAPTSDAPGENSGRIFAFSGADGSMILSASGPPADAGGEGFTGHFFGHSVAIPGDINGDGHADILVGAPSDPDGEQGYGRVTLHSGHNASVLYTIDGGVLGGRLGVDIAVMDDVDGDGFKDLVVSAPGPFFAGPRNRGKVLVYSGQHGKFLHLIQSPNMDDGFGYSVATAGGGAGPPLIIVGAPYTDTAGGDNAGAAYVFEYGQTEPAYELTGSSPFGYLGLDVAGLGDLDGDGTGEVVVGEPVAGNGLISPGRAHVLSGADGATIFTIDGVDDLDYVGFGVASAGDVDGDGVEDVAVSALNMPTEIGEGVVRIVSGASGATIVESFDSGQYDGLFGISLAAAGDLDGDGFDDVIVGSGYYTRYENDQFIGSATVISGGTLPAPDPHALIATFDSPESADGFGVHIAAAGDVDGDRVDDLLVTAAYSDAGASNGGSLSLVSGAGETIWVRNGAPGLLLGRNGVAGTGDMDGDDVPDALVWAYPGELAVNAVSGATGGLIRSMVSQAEAPENFARSFDAAGDVNGDRLVDIVIGAPGNDEVADDAGAVYLYSGADGALIRRHDGEYMADYLGSAVAGAGDVDADGIPDLLVGASAVTAIPTRPGRAFVFSGADGALLATFEGEFPGDAFGEAVDGAGDVDGDGHADLLIGAHGAAPLQHLTGRVYLYSGATAALLHVFIGENPDDHFGRTVAGIGDFNADGFPDVAIGAPEAVDPTCPDSRGLVSVYSGRDGALVARICGERLDVEFGNSIAGLGDINGDGFADLAVGTHPAPLDEPQRVHIYRGGGPAADLDGDGDVDVDDLEMLLANWGGSGLGDLTGDCRVTTADLLALVAGRTRR